MFEKTQDEERRSKRSGMVAIPGEMWDRLGSIFPILTGCGFDYKVDVDIVNDFVLVSWHDTDETGQAAKKEEFIRREVDRANFKAPRPAATFAGYLEMLDWNAKS